MLNNSVENTYIFASPGVDFGKQFPGQQFGGSIEQIRGLITKQKRFTGLLMTLAVGFNEFSFKMSGSARMLLGILLFTGNDTETVSLIINDELILDNCPVTCLCSFNRSREQEYFMFPRPLTGSDVVKVVYQSTGAAPNFMNFYFL